MNVRDYPPVSFPACVPWEQDPAELIEEERIERERRFWENIEKEEEDEDISAFEC